MNNLTLVLGGPGCGKTTRLLEIVEREMSEGVSPSQIAFVAFTKEAASVAQARAAEKFGLNPQSDLPYFRTIHSLAYQQLGLARDEVMGPRDWKEFGLMVGETITGRYDFDSPMGGERARGDMMLRIVDYASTTLQSLEDAYHALMEPVDWHALKRFASALEQYKRDSDKLDFSDMLMRYVRDGSAVNVRVAVIDEAQDLTASQWAVVRHAFAGCERVYVGGDDDQAIYHWAGADVKQFLALTRTPEVLPHSHRLSRRVWELAQRLAGRISQRYLKQYSPDDRDGLIEHHQHPDSVDFSHGSWLFLARNNYMLARLEALARASGINYQRRWGPAVKPEDVALMKLWERLRSGKQKDLDAKDARAVMKGLDRPVPQLRELQRYSPADLGIEAPLPIWHEALAGIPMDRREYYISCLRRGEKLTAAPRVRIETIHGVKGAEADHVMLMTDISLRTARGFAGAPDSEHRVFYVGVTRAKHSLHLIAPQSEHSYPL